MADDYDKTREFGKPENIGKRLSMWAHGLSTDSRYPWAGLGLIDDLKCASRLLGGEPDKQYPDMRTPEPKPEPAKATEYDL